MTTILITGAAGFVGHHLVEHVMKTTDWNVVGLARMNFAGDVNRLASIEKFGEYGDRVRLVYHDLKFDINPGVSEAIGKVDYIAHIAANSHVDRSITHPKEFFMDNVIGTVNLLEWARLTHPNTPFLNFGTDEVFGPAPEGYDYKEEDRYRPSNPYSAAKAGQICAGHSYFVTYGMPVISTYTMNIFGERQNPEKLVAKAIQRIVAGETIEIHSKLPEGMEKTDDRSEVEYVGQRHWLHARNACDAVLYLLQNGTAGEHYNVVGDVELDNDEMVNKIAAILGKPANLKYVDFHKTRPGHDRRYALDGTKLKELGWVPPVSFDESLKKTVEWTLHDS